MASELQQSQQEKLQKQGINFIPVRQGLKALERLINSNRGKLGVLSIDWHIFSLFLQSLFSVTRSIIGDCNNINNVNII